MIMKGIIFDINWERGMVAVLTESEDYSVFELLSEEHLDIGDEVSWNENHPLGDCKIKNYTKNEIIEIYFQDHWVNNQNLKSRLLYQ